MTKTAKDLRLNPPKVLFNVFLCPSFGWHFDASQEKEVKPWLQSSFLTVMLYPT